MHIPIESGCSDRLWQFRLQIFIILGERGVLGFDVVFFHLFLPVGIHLDFGRQQSGHGHEFKVGITDQLAGQPKERLFEVVVGFGRNVVILKEKPFFEF